MLYGYPLQFSTNALIGAGRILLLNNIYFSRTVCRPMLSAVSCSRLAGTLLIECGMAREPGTDGEREGGGFTRRPSLPSSGGRAYFFVNWLR